MKPSTLSVPLGVGLALAGAAMLLAANRQSPGRVLSSTEWRLLSQPRHPVTPEMWKEADAAVGEIAPTFSAKDSDGRELDLEAISRTKPVFLYFVQDGCPCSIEAQPHFERLFRRFRDKVAFVAISDGDPSQAAKWKSEFSVPYPVIPDPGLDLMRLFGVERSVYSLFIGKGRLIVRMWPGYSAAMLLQANGEMAKAGGLAVAEFDTQAAPSEMTSGCAFAPEIRNAESAKRG